MGDIISGVLVAVARDAERLDAADLMVDVVVAVVGAAAAAVGAAVGAMADAAVVGAVVVCAAPVVVALPESVFS